MAAEVLPSVLDSFPPVQHAFAYGSGVFKQPGLYEAPAAAEEVAAAGGGGGGGAAARAADQPMLDFIFAVDDPVAWHEENLRRHAHHYSLLGRLGPTALTAVAERLGAGVYFNTLVPWRPHQLIKYGVVRLAALQADLLHWTSLYCAGRLHKPVATLVQHPGVAAAQRENLLSALRVALLLLPPRFGTLDLLHAVCAISYSGDVRMGLAEDSRKVHRIVAGSEAGLRQLYAAPLAAAQRDWRALEPTAVGVSSNSSGSDDSGDSWVRNDSPAATAELATGLPAHVLQRLAAPLGLAPPGQQEGEKLHAVGRALAAADRHRQQQLLRHAIHAIVGASSKRQALSGLLTAGVVKSVRYGVAKFRKAWR